MRSFLYFLAAASLWLPFSSCEKQAAGTVSDKPALIVNHLRLNQEELKQEYQTASLMRHEAPLSQGQEPEWVSRLIERELLVQEAQRLGLDRQEAFMRSVERFWKEVLIKTLIERKGREIGEEAHVYEPEIEAYYKKLTEENSGKPVEPLSLLREDIRREVRRMKEMDAMEQWIAGLRERAKIVVDQESLRELQ